MGGAAPMAPPEPTTPDPIVTDNEPPGLTAIGGGAVPNQPPSPLRSFHWFGGCFRSAMSDCSGVNGDGTRRSWLAVRLRTSAVATSGLRARTSSERPWL